MLSRERILDILKEAGVLTNGHFLLTSGRHSGVYLQCARVFENPKYTEMLCKDLAQKFYDQKIDIVIGPAMGAVQMAYEVSRQLGVLNFFTERVDNKMELRRGFLLKEGQRVLVVEDVITTGGTVKEVIDFVNATGATVAGVGCIIDRTDGKIDFGVPFQSVIGMSVDSYLPEECPLCRTTQPLVKPGSRKTAKNN